MPFGDKTGPVGMGPMTGRQAGYCRGYSAGYGAQRPFAPGRRCLGTGFGRGRGLGYRNRYFSPYAPGQVPYFDPNINRYAAPVTQDDEKRFLQQEADALQTHLGEIRKRLDELESANSE